MHLEHNATAAKQMIYQELSMYIFFSISKRTTSGCNPGLPAATAMIIIVQFYILYTGMSNVSSTLQAQSLSSTPS